MAHIQVTEYDQPDVVVDSLLRGRVPNALWSVREAEALAAAGIAAFVRRNGGSRIAVFRGSHDAVPPAKLLHVATPLL